MKKHQHLNFGNDRRKNILIIDDSPDNLRLLSSTLTKQGYQVRCAKSGSIALTGVRNFLPDLILLDIKMPEMNGYEVCQKLKANEQTCAIPVIFLSALDEPFDKVRAFAVGAVDYITKPFQVEEVLARINHQLELQTAKVKIYQLNAELEQRVQLRTAELEAVNQKLKREISDRIQAQILAKDSQDRLESILNYLQQVVWSAEIETLKLLYLNPAAQTVYARTSAEFFHNPKLWLEVVHSEDRDMVEQSIPLLLSKGSIELEYRILRPNGEVRWLSDRRQVIYDTNGVAIRVDGIIDDITKRKRIEQKLIHDALHDRLTGLPNRTLFVDRLEMAIKRAKRHQDYLFAVLFIDLDRFKIVNDNLGHCVGDRLLIAIARLLQQCLRANDTIARFGGDEFTVLLDEIQGISDATNIAQRILQQLKSPFNLEGHSIVTSASIGIVFSSQNYKGASELLQNADIAMYRAKERGKGRYEIFNRAGKQQSISCYKSEPEKFS